MSHTFSPEVQAILDRVKNGTPAPSRAERIAKDRAERSAKRAAEKATRTPKPRKPRVHSRIPDDQRRPPGPARIITAEQADEALTRYNAGETYAAIAATMGLGANTIRRTIVDAAAEGKHVRQGKLDRPLVYTQRLAGMSVADIATDHKVSQSTVRKYLNGTDLAGMRDKQGRKPATTCRACEQPKEPGEACVPCRRKRGLAWHHRQKAS